MPATVTDTWLAVIALLHVWVTLIAIVIVADRNKAVTAITLLDKDWSINFL